MKPLVLQDRCLSLDRGPVYPDPNSYIVCISYSAAGTTRWIAYVVTNDLVECWQQCVGHAVASACIHIHPSLMAAWYLNQGRVTCNELKKENKSASAWVVYIVADGGVAPPQKKGSHIDTVFLLYRSRPYLPKILLWDSKNTFTEGAPSHQAMPRIEPKM